MKIPLDNARGISLANVPRMNLNTQVHTTRPQKPKSPSVNLRKKIGHLSLCRQCLTEKALKRLNKAKFIAQHDEQLVQAPEAPPLPSRLQAIIGKKGAEARIMT